MGNLDNCNGRSPCSLSSSDSLRHERSRSSNKDSIAQLIEVISRPREAGGFGSSLRYCDLERLLQQFGCVWSTDRMDDCWYDMVRGRPEGVVSDMGWAAECIHGYLQEKLIESAPPPTPPPQQQQQKKQQHKKQLQNSKVLFEEHSASTPLTETPKPLVPFLSPESRPEIPDDAPLSSSSSSSRSRKRSSSLQERKPPQQPQQQEEEKEEKEPQQHVPRDSAAVDDHFVYAENPRYASPTLSSIRRNRSASAPSRGNKAKAVGSSAASGVHVSPRNRRLSPSQSREVFQRLIEDANNRRSRAKTTASPPEAIPTTLSTKTNMKRSDRSASSKLIPPRPSPNVCRWSKPTKSYEAKLTPEPPSIDRLEAIGPTPHVERQEPRGPSAFVPPGYVEAVARLRRFAASRESQQAFADTLRSTSPTVPSPAIEQTPILRLPMQDDAAKKKMVVDVRLATPLRSRHLLFPRDIPFDDPSRVLIQNILSETRMKCR